LLELVRSFEEERIDLPIVPSTPVGLRGEVVPKKGVGKKTMMSVTKKNGCKQTKRKHWCLVSQVSSRPTIKT
jgi:hypothetical protein